MFDVPRDIYQKVASLQWKKWLRFFISMILHWRKSKAMCTVYLYYHSAALGFSTQTKSSEDETSFSTCYNVKEVGISQGKYLSSGFPLSYHLNSAGRAALVGRLAGTV